MASLQSSPPPPKHTSPSRATATATATVFQEEENTHQPQFNKMMLKNNKGYMQLLTTNYICLFVGSISSALLSKFYFIHKGRSRWVSTWVQCVGFPLLLFPIYLPYYVFNCTTRKPFTKFTPKLLFLSVVIGLMLGFNNLLFSWGNSYLPLSTFSLLLSSQLVFTLLLSMIIVKQKITFSNLNCVILLTLSSVLLALSPKHDKAEGQSKGKYFIGFFSTIGAGLLFSLYLPVMERVYRHLDCYSMVMEMQLVMEIAASVLATVVMAASGGFAEMKKESCKAFDLGAKAYWLTVSFNVVTWQLLFMGTAGMVFLTTSLTGGICATALLSANVLGGVLVYGDDFGGVKVVSTLLCIWGFCSYVYGMYAKMKKEKEKMDTSGGDGDHRQQRRHLEMPEIVTQSDGLCSYVYGMYAKMNKVKENMDRSGGDRQQQRRHLEMPEIVTQSG